MKLLLCAGCFICFDIVTGLLKALYCRNFNSTIMREGGFHKIAEFLAMLAAYGVEYTTSVVHLGIDVPAVGVVAAYLCIMEAISIIENLCEVNPQLRELFQPYLEKLKGGERHED